MTAYYNENDPFAAAWLVELMKDGLIADGWVDTRSIWDVRSADVKGFTQCHFFAGIGVWSLALRLAGWPDDRPVWTGSAPCQPFSAAGKGEGFADERHLWPAWFHLITHGKRRDIPVLGEQVAAKAGRAWFDLVSADMEALDHACGALDTSAAGCGAPFIGQRLYWLASAHHQGSQGYGRPGQLDAASGRQVAIGHGAETGAPVGLAATRGATGQWNTGAISGTQAQVDREGQFDGGVYIGHSDDGDALRLAASESNGRSERAKVVDGLRERNRAQGSLGRLAFDGDILTVASDRQTEHSDGIPLHPVEYWRDADWLLCRDPNGARFRPVESPTQRMADVRSVGRSVVDRSGEGQTHFPLCEKTEYKNRLNEVRGFGNALNVAQAATFCEIARDYLDGAPVA